MAAYYEVKMKTTKIIIIKSYLSIIIILNLWVLKYLLINIYIQYNI